MADKLGISKTQLLAIPEIADLYKKFQKGEGMKKRQKGMGIFDGFVKFLKDSKILSKIGGVLLPLAGGALGGLATVNPLGASIGAAAGSAGNKWIESQGFGKGGLSISPIGQRLGQRGMGKHTMKMKGKGCGCMRGYGSSTAFGTVSSEYGKVRFA
jgi:hypothetical protein